MHNLHILKVSAAVVACTRQLQDQTHGKWLTSTHPQRRNYWQLMPVVGRERWSVFLRVVALRMDGPSGWPHTPEYMSRTSWMGYKKKKRKVEGMKLGGEHGGDLEEIRGPT